MKKLLVIVLLLCCVGCSYEEGKIYSNIELSNKVFDETLNGHKDKTIEDAMSVDEALSLVNNSLGELYDTIEYYDMVKFKPGNVENDYYAFYVTSGDGSYYILIDIYNGATTFATEETLGIKK